MKIIFCFLFVILSIVISSNPCEEIINHDECISKEGCCYVENSFRSYINRQCIFIETEESKNEEKKSIREYLPEDFLNFALIKVQHFF